MMNTLIVDGKRYNIDLKQAISLKCASLMPDALIKVNQIYRSNFNGIYYFKLAPITDNVVKLINLTGNHWGQRDG